MDKDKEDRDIDDDPIEYEYTMTKEEEEIVANFNKNRATREYELRAVLAFMQEDLNLKMHNATKYEKALSYFRGIDFHLLTLANS